LLLWLQAMTRSRSATNALPVTPRRPVDSPAGPSPTVDAPPAREARLPAITDGAASPAPIAEPRLKGERSHAHRELATGGQRPGVMPGVIEPVSSPAPERRLQRFAANLEQASAHQLVPVSSTEHIIGFADELLAGRSQRLAIGCYYKSPTLEHYAIANAFVKQLVEKLGAPDVALVTSPSTGKFGEGDASTDYMTTTIAHETGAKPFYVTSVGYVPELDMSTLPEPAQQTWSQTPKFVFPTEGQYGEAAMTASNRDIVTGGRLASVSDFVKMTPHGNTAVLMIDKSLGPLKWETDKPSDASAYLDVMLDTAEKLRAAGRDVTDEASYPFPFMPQVGFDGDFLADNAAALRARTLSVEVSSLGDVPAAVVAAAKHLEAAQA
jgi:hypothetical protein